LVDLNQIKVLAWDIGGTVFNWRGTIQKELDIIARKQKVEMDIFQFASDWRYGMFDMLAKVRNGEIPRINADQIHRKVLDDVIASHGTPSLSKDERDNLNAVWHKLDAWDDAPKAIERLRDRYTVVPLTVLSWSIGVDCSKFNGINWDGLISCEFLRQYKPDAGSYLHAAELLNVSPNEIMMCAAHTNDLKAAKEAGFKTAFVYREMEKARDVTNNRFSEEPSVPLEFFDVHGQNFTELANKLLA
jgi:2-haloacid dehalogenase